MKINKSRYALLGILMYQEMSGYDIKKAIDDSIANFWTEDYGRIYPELRRMEEEGYIVKVPEIKESGPNRNIYKITEKGEKDFDKWARSHCEKQQNRNELLLKIFFGNDNRIDDIIQKIEKEKEENEKALKRYAQLEKRMEDEKPEDAVFWGLTLTYGIYRAEGILKWCDNSLKLLNDIKNRGKCGI